MVNWEKHAKRNSWRLEGFVLDRGQHRPHIQEIDGVYYTNGTSGYVRKYTTLEEAKEYAGHVPTMTVARRLSEEHWTYIRDLLRYEFECNESPVAAEVLHIIDTTPKE